MNISEEDVLKVFRMYIGIKLHFSKNDFVYTDTFRNKAITASSMDKRKDIDFFIKVAELYHGNYDELKQVMISHFIEDSNTWIGKMLDKISTNSYHLKRLGNCMSIQYLLEKDIETVNDYMYSNDLTIEEMIDCTNQDRPLIVKKLKLSDEFLSLLDYKYDYLGSDTMNPFWEKRKFMLKKYKYLINRDILDLEIMLGKIISK